MRPVAPLFRATWLALLLTVPTGVAIAQNLPCPDPPLHPPTHAFVQPPRPCPEDDVRILFATCAPCWDIVSVGMTRDGITVRTVGGGACPAVCLPESASIGLGRFASGRHAVVVRFVTETFRADSATGDSVLCTFAHLDTLKFEVSNTCNQNSLPYVKEVLVGGPPPCIGCPPQICAGDSIPVLVRGEFPDDCIKLRGVQLVEDGSMGPLPVPPIVRIVYFRNECTDQACIQVPVPWEAQVKLPPLPALAGHNYWLRVETALVRTCGPPPDSSIIGNGQFPFAVAADCTTGLGACFLTSFEASAPSFERCDDFVGPDRPGYATFRIGSNVPLHGLEGRFSFAELYPARDPLPPGVLEVTGIEAIGAAARMRLAWQPTEDGARFVLYSEGGAFIPRSPPMPSTEHLPILRIEVRLRATATPPPRRIRLHAYNLLGSDAQARGVELCPIVTLVVPYDSYAIFCTGGACDFNRDGRTDVRDLVMMVNCLNDSTRCDLTRADCDGDGSFDLDDVLCCAHVLLGGGPPDTTGGRPDPSLRVRFGAPVDRDGVTEVPVLVDGANPVGASRLVLRFPDDRFTIAGVEFPGRSTWLELHQVNGNQLTVGMLDMAGLPESGFHRSFTLRLALRPGQRAGGEVALEAAEFSDPRGVALLADLGSPAVALGGGTVALGPGTPNPFAREVHFAVTLVEPAHLEVSVHDLTGRRVAVLHDGPAAAGGHGFTWDGRSTDGSSMADGVYFYRVRAAGLTLSRKVILLRGR